MAQIFISYSRVDRPFTRKLEDSLRRVYTVWYDEALTGGQDWWNEILNQIDDCDVFIYLLSEDSVKSNYCLAEYDVARTLHKKILPVLIRQRTSIPDRLSRLHYVDMSEGFTAQSITDLRDALDRLIQQLPGEVLPVYKLTRPPVPEITDKPLFEFRFSIVSTVVVVAVVIIAATLILLTRGRSSGSLSAGIPTSQLPEADSAVVVTQVTQEPSSTLMPTSTLTPTVTPSETAGPATQVRIDSTSTAQAVAFFATVTAALWTPTATSTFTSTPDVTQTYDSELRILRLTNTAEAWTSTPSPSPTATLTEEQRALRLAVGGVNSNEEWTPYTKNLLGLEMVLVPSGCFFMGSEDGDEDERPMREQCVETPFWIGRFEVTNGQYLDGQPARSIDQDCDGATSVSNHPQNCINWYSARGFCSEFGARLPTELEWEYAARGPSSLLYPWGNSFLPSNTVYVDASESVSAEVGSRPTGASWVGAMDMSGNVWEWTSSLIEDYPYSQASHEDDSELSSQRVIRGGSFSNPDFILRASNRLDLPPGQALANTGFRCARDFDG